jgi:hypothetical protein
MIEIITCVILLFALVLRLLPRLLWKNLNGTDNHFHFFLINTIKNNQHIIPIKEQRIFGGSNWYTYPYYYHWLLSFFPNNFIIFWDKFSGSIFDIIIGWSLGWLLYHFSIVNEKEMYLFFSTYILSPGLTFSLTVGPRPFSLTARNFAQFIFTIACCCLLISLSCISWDYSLRIFFFVLASFFFAILLLSSQFGTQVLIALLATGFFNLYIPLCIILGFCIGIILSKGFLITQIKAQIHHLKWYFRYNYTFVKHKSNFFTLFSHIKTKNIRGIFYELLFFNQLTGSLLKHPTYFLAIVLGLIYWSDNRINHLQCLILSICLSVYIPFVLTNFGKMRVFGEAERYIEYVFPLQIFLFFSFISTASINIIIYSLLTYNFIFYFYNLYQLRSQNHHQYDFDNLTKKLRNDHMLLCLSNNETYIFLNKTKTNLVGFLVNITLKGQLDTFFKNFFICYPMVNPKEIKNLCNHFKVTHILKNKHHGFLEEYDYAINQLENCAIYYEDETYTLYTLTNNI